MIDVQSRRDKIVDYIKSDSGKSAKELYELIPLHNTTKVSFERDLRQLVKLGRLSYKLKPIETLHLSRVYFPKSSKDGKGRSVE